MPLIDKKLLNHLANLSRLNLTKKEENRFLKDLGEILAYFEELQAVDTKNVEPMSGGTDLTNIFRPDEVDLSRKAETVSDSGRIIDAFPESERGYLKVPKIL